MSDTRPSALATWGALAVVYVVWGSTYLAIRVLDRHVPPMLGMGARFLIAAVLLAALLAVRHGWSVLRVPPRRALGAALIGVLLLAGGNGAVAVAEQTVPSGLAALVVAAVPLWIVCLRLLSRDIPRTATIAGTVIGFGGLALLTLPGGHPAGTALWGLLTIIGGTLSWATGSFVSQRLALPGQPFVATVYEMLAAGLVLTLGGVATGEPASLHFGAIPAQGWIALAYLILIGSIVAFSAYVWLLGHVPLSLTATYAYVNPIVAVALGAVILGEPLTVPILIGGGVVVAGVCVVVSSERVARRVTPPPDQPRAPLGGPSPDGVTRSSASP